MPTPGPGEANAAEAPTGPSTRTIVTTLVVLLVVFAAIGLGQRAWRAFVATPPAAATAAPR